uniref:integrase core domain-containing protein n=1 Tax=Neisseria chenwenguii TaxID=1853278 RepID=UPI001F2CB59A
HCRVCVFGQRGGIQRQRLPPVRRCLPSNNIVQKFTRITRPQTNGKAERVIRTLTEMRHGKRTVDDPEHRRKELCRFVNFYNTVKPYRGLEQYAV